MPSTLVVYGTWSGSTADVAARIADGLMRRGVRVRVSTAAAASEPSLFDAVVLGSAVRSGAWHPSVTSWARNNSGVLKRKQLAVFSVCLTPECHGDRTSEARGYAMPAAIESGVSPVASGVFAGAYDPARVPFADRVKARVWGAKRGDFRDWAAIDAWTAELAESIARV